MQIFRGWCFSFLLVIILALLWLFHFNWLIVALAKFFGVSTDYLLGLSDSSTALKGFFSVVYEDGKLFIEFISSGWYKYLQVPESVFERFLKDSSKGRFFNRFVKNIYRDEPLTSQELEKVSLMPLEK